MINFDAVAVFSILTILGSIVLLVVLGLKMRNKVFGNSVAENTPSLGDDHGKA